MVFGSRALAMPLPHTAMTLTAKRHLRNRRGAKSSHSIMVNGRNLISDLLPTLNQAIDLLTPKNYPKGRSSSTYHISIDTHIPLGAGLGASAALSITLLRSLAELHHKKLSTEQVMQLAHELEKRFHGNPSGVDVHAIAHESLISFEMISGAKPYPAPGRFPLVLVDTGVRSSTKMMVQRSTEFFESDSRRTKRLIFQFNYCHDHILSALKSGTYSGVIDSLEYACTLLRDINVVGEVIEQAISTLESLGLRGLKPTGSGGAGFVLAALPQDPGARQHALAKIAEHFDTSPAIEVWL